MVRRGAPGRNSSLARSGGTRRPTKLSGGLVVGGPGTCTGISSLAGGSGKHQPQYHPPLGPAPWEREMGPEITSLFQGAAALRTFSQDVPWAAHEDDLEPEPEATPDPFSATPTKWFGTPSQPGPHGSSHSASGPMVGSAAVHRKEGWEGKEAGTNTHTHTHTVITHSLTLNPIHYSHFNCFFLLQGQAASTMTKKTGYIVLSRLMIKGFGLSVAIK
ncbi:hypothetical protein ACJZ2D_002920 [Fusarium nematophilum]